MSNKAWGFLFKKTECPFLGLLLIAFVNEEFFIFLIGLNWLILWIRVQLIVDEQVFLVYNIL